MAKVNKAQFTVKGLPKGTRLDRVLRDQFPRWGRQAVQQTISAQKVRLNGRIVRLSSWEVRNGDRIEVLDPPQEKVEAASTFDPKWIIADTKEFLVVNKPAGLLSEGTRFSETPGLLELAKIQFGELHLFHRLDRDTSGLVLLTRPGEINKVLDEAFKNRTVLKQYMAVVKVPNGLAREGTIVERIGPHPDRRDKMAIVPRGGLPAVTRYELMDEQAGKQLVKLWPETGRTHQLRVHLAHLNAPILGDRLYGGGVKEHARLLLHAQKLELPEAMGVSFRSFEAPLPAGFWPPGK